MKAEHNWDKEVADFDCFSFFIQALSIITFDSISFLIKSFFRVS